MAINLSSFKALRMYRNMPLLTILNNIMCNRTMKIPFLVNNASKLYAVSIRVLGRGFTNACINATFCKMLTAGNTI